MRILSRSLALALIGLVWVPPFSLRQAVASMPMRAIILFDISGSMLKNDPERLSQAAAKLFLALAGSQDKVGLVAFSDQGIPIMSPTPLHSRRLREWLQAQMDGLQFTGQTTNLAAALEAGLTSFPAQQDNTARDLALLLTDGKLDLGPQRRAEEPAMLHHIRQTLLPQYKQRGIALYTIAFTEAADQALLQEMAQATAGEFRFIHSAKGLHEAFQELFQVARQTETLPLTDNAFFLDNSITEASLVVSKKTGQKPLSLITPQQERVNANSASPGVTWTSTPAYDLVQFVDPTPGKWQSEGEEKAAASVALVRVKDDALDAVVQGYARLERANRTLRLTNSGLKLENEANKKTLADYEKRIARYTDIQAENFELQQQVNRSSHAATAEQETRFLKQELWEVKNKLVQRETELRSVQEQYEDLSAEYHRLFSCLKT